MAMLLGSRSRSRGRGGLGKTVRSLWEGKEAPHAYLERLGLADAHSFKDLFVRRLFADNL